MQLSLILFAIRASVKLGTAARKAYVEDTRDRDLILPPLKTDLDIPVGDARNFFLIHEEYLDPQRGLHANPARIRALLDDFNGGDWDEEKEAELIKLYKECRSTEYLRTHGSEWTEGGPLTDEEIEGLLALGTWTREGQSPVWWKTIGEALFDVGLDYAMNDPNICNPETSSGKALSTFFASLQELDLTEAELENVPSFMLTTTLDILSSHPGVITGGKRGQALLAATTKTLGKDIAKRLGQDGDTETREWCELVFQSLLTSGGRLAVSDPGAYLGIHGEHSEAMTEAIGGALLDVVLESDDQLNLKGIFDLPALEAVSDAALLAVAKHPDMIAADAGKGVRGLITDMARDIAAMDALFCREAGPEIIRLTLENTADNLEHLWPDVNEPQQHLLCQAAKKTLSILGKAPAGDAAWKLEFSRDDAVDVVAHVFTEIKANPAWITGDSDILNDVLPVALDEVLAVIRARGGKETTREAARSILKATLTSALTRAELIGHSEYEGEMRPFIVACVDLALAAAFQSGDRKVKYRLARLEGLKTLVAVVLSAAEEGNLGMDEAARTAALQKLEIALGKVVDDVENGRGIDWNALEQSLS
ncbi:hypothetical protein [Salidesulfovibrio brasiliensis]|uniref:hypothetical protein n=1 Tax=Salidesulfovibrio brasiliensis TaxID=221711 RepID=UPI0006CFCE37|nr:hypothetical protein [Salidesulfovibrio brasiliensis]